MAESPLQGNMNFCQMVLKSPCLSPFRGLVLRDAGEDRAAHRGTLSVRHDSRRLLRRRGEHHTICTALQERLVTVTLPILTLIVPAKFCQFFVMCLVNKSDATSLYPYTAEYNKSVSNNRFCNFACIFNIGKLL